MISLEQIQSASLRLLTASVWFSTLLFGLYILAFYAASYSSEPEKWNQGLAGLYVVGGRLANSSIGVHFLAGGIILILGCIQLSTSIRRRAPYFHRITGRIYLLACLTTAIGGLAFILLRGTIGGWVMDIGFGAYGVLMFACSVQTFRFALRRELSSHRAWALRLFALAIGSWLYRMEYGLWFMLTDAMGHQPDFSGWFDRVMAFFFFIPNLIVVEMVLRFDGVKRALWMHYSLITVLIMSTTFILIGTWVFWDLFWSQPILKLIQ